MRSAPGYLSDAAELDARYADTIRTRLAQQNRTPIELIETTAKAWLHADLGESREFNQPVWPLLKPRIASSAILLVTSMAAGWAYSPSQAPSLWASLIRTPSRPSPHPSRCSWQSPPEPWPPLSLLTNLGGPSLVLTLLIAARDFKFCQHLLSEAWRAPHLLQARAQGLSHAQLVRAHILPALAPQLRALAAMSASSPPSAHSSQWKCSSTAPGIWPDGPGTPPSTATCPSCSPSPSSWRPSSAASGISARSQQQVELT